MSQYSNHLNDITQCLSQTPTANKSELVTQINTISSVVMSSAEAISELSRGVFELYENKTCPKCGARIGYYVAESTDRIICPECKAPIY